jgi:hypothetical protein
VAGGGGARFISKPSKYMTQKDLTRNEANIADIDRARELLNQGTPGTPYTKEEIQVRNEYMGRGSKALMDGLRGDKVFHNRQTEDQISFSIPGDDKLVYKSGANLKEHAKAEKAYMRALDKRDAAAVEGNKRGVTVWNNKSREILEKHVARHGLAGPGMVLSAGILGVNAVQKDIDKYGSHLSKLNKASKSKTAFTSSKSTYNRLVKELVSKDFFASDSKHLPQHLKAGLTRARSFQRAGLRAKGPRLTSNIKTRNMRGRQLTGLFNAHANFSQSANKSLTAQMATVKRHADQQGIAYSGITQSKINSHATRAANGINRKTRAKAGDSDRVRRTRIKTALAVAMRRNKREAQEAFTSGKIRLTQ